MFGGVYNKGEDQGPPGFVYYFAVKDVKASEGQVKKLGGSILAPPMEVPGGSWILVAQDPQGAIFGLHSMAK